LGSGQALGAAPSPKHRGHAWTPGSSASASGILLKPQDWQATPEATEKFATYYRDATGLDYAWNRYYTAAWSRFMQADPSLTPEALKNPQGWNRYAYVAGDPVNYYDPAGMDPCSGNYGVPCFSITVVRFLYFLWLRSFGGGGGGSWDLPVPDAAEPIELPEPGLDLEAGGSSLPRWLQVVLDRRQALLAAIYGTGDDVFGGEILDCMAGRESAWDPSAVSATGARGLFQITETAWEEIYKGVPNAPEYKLEVWDPARSAAAAAAYLRILLSRIVGRERYLARDYSEGDLKKAIQA
jgi:RHS repeat-associated protein